MRKSAVVFNRGDLFELRFENKPIKILSSHLEILHIYII